MKWIMKVDCELEKKVVKSYKKKSGRQEEFIYFCKSCHKYKELFSGANRSWLQNFFFCNLSLSRVHRLKWKTFDNINLNQTC